MEKGRETLKELESIVQSNDLDFDTSQKTIISYLHSAEHEKEIILSLLKGDTYNDLNKVTGCEEIENYIRDQLKTNNLEKDIVSYTNISEVIFVYNKNFYLGATVYSEEEGSSWKTLEIDIEAYNTIIMSGDRFAREYKGILEDKNRYNGLIIIVYLSSTKNLQLTGIESVIEFEKARDYATGKIKEALKDPESIPSYIEEETLKKYVEDYLIPYTGFPGGVCSTSAASCNFIYNGKFYIGGTFRPDAYAGVCYKNSIPDLSIGLHLYPISADGLLDSVMNTREVNDANYIVIINDESLKECERVEEVNNNNDNDSGIEIQQDDFVNEPIILPLMKDPSDKKTNPYTESIKHLNRKLDLCIFASSLILIILLIILKYVC